jgi:hypothetical protein
LSSRKLLNTRQNDHCFSDCTVSVIQILDDADVAFRISGIADRSIRDHHARRQAITALSVGLPAQRVIAQRFSALAHQRSGGTPH